MYNSDTELLFPPRVIPVLRDLRGRKWEELVDQVVPQDEMSPDKLAFVLMMIRLNGCLTCNADSYRAMRGCTDCAVQTLRRNRDKDEKLLKMYAKAKNDLAKTKRPGEA